MCRFSVWVKLVTVFVKAIMYRCQRQQNYLSNSYNKLSLKNNVTLYICFLFYIATNLNVILIIKFESILKYWNYNLYIYYQFTSYETYWNIIFQFVWNHFVLGSFILNTDVNWELSFIGQSSATINLILLIYSIFH